jgi:glyoxylase I family protein
VTAAGPRGLSHLAVLVRDLDAAEGFYAGVLDLAVIRRWEDDAGRPRSVWLDLGDGGFLAVERAGAAGPRRADDAPGHHCLALRIDAASRPGWVARLGSAGVAVERETAYTVYFRDPEGNLVALSHWPDVAPG